MPKKITRAVKGQIKAEHLKGKTIAEIAEAYGISERTVQDITKKNRHKVLEEAKTMSKAEKEERIKHLLAETGMKQQEIAEMYDVQPTWVTRIAKKYRLRAWKEKEMEFKNPEGYADPTAFMAMNPNVMPGEIWEIKSYKAGENKLMLILQVFDTFAICVGLQPNLEKIPEYCEEKVLCRPAPFADCSKPNVVYKTRFIRKEGELTVNRMIGIRQKVADIILRGYPDEKPALATQDVPRSDFKPELDKIPTEEEKPQETAGNTLEQDDAIRAVLQYKAASLEALTERLLDIVEAAVQKGA